MIELDDFESIYRVDLPDFTGPLDLLLSLIEQEEMDITKIALAQVTDQYLAHLDDLRQADPDELSDFLVIAAKLILIKSEMLLPRPPPILAEEAEEDVGDELARQLIIYKRFKELAGHLRDIEALDQRSFVRVVPQIKVEPKLVPGEGNLKALLAAARRALTIKPEPPAVDEMVSPQSVTIGQQMSHIWRLITTKKQIAFQELLSQNRNKIEVIVTLLAILELIKRRIVDVGQINHFGNIIIEKRANVELSESEWEALIGLTEVS
ncbi:MAG: segregation/condensation protein A [Anaerolineaceae bacterium]|nr:segregation/condensation protein A [Anaerolineaceae bacterium]MCB9099944.1 segregation/condensation protein A [Anaerolineales bacterium]